MPKQKRSLLDLCGIGCKKKKLALDNIYSAIVADGRCSVELALVMMSQRDRRATLSNNRINQIRSKISASSVSY